MADLPDGYQKAKAAPRDEHNPRPARHVGKPRVCQCCYRSAHDIFDYVCKRCLKDRYDLAVLEQEIARVFPATARLTSVQIFRRLWEQNQKLSNRLKEIKKKAKQ